MPDTLLTGRKADLGHGLTVRRLLPAGSRRRSVGPFVFFDHAGPVTLAPEDIKGADVRPHPHIGLATVSYVLGGEIIHRDSLGTFQRIRPGAVNWMTAGRGITHSERFEHPASFAGGGLELLQMWVALPEADEECAPAFEHTDESALPVRDDPASGVWLRVVAGSAYGLDSPVRTLSPLFCVHAELQPGSTLALPVPGSGMERAVYVVRGEIEHAGTRCAAGQMLVWNDPQADAEANTGNATATATNDANEDGTSPGDGDGDGNGSGHGPADGGDDDAAPMVSVGTEPATVLLVGGTSLGPRHLFWNFVSSRRERIDQAKADWRAGRFALPPDDHDEWIPLPSPASALAPSASPQQAGAGSVPPANAS